MISVDETPGIQARQRDGKTVPMKEDCVERREFHSIRHGTQVLTGHVHMATGELISPTIADTRTEADCALPMKHRIHTDSLARFMILCDQLKTHQSETFVHVIASMIGDIQNLGVKGKQGILRSMASRQAYLRNPSHRIRFMSPLKPWSWCNSIDVRFFLLDQHMLRRGNFSSSVDGKEKIQRPIASDADHFAKAWRWSVTRTKDIQRLLAKMICHLFTTPVSVMGYVRETVLGQKPGVATRWVTAARPAVSHSDLMHWLFALFPPFFHAFEEQDVLPYPCGQVLTDLAILTIETSAYCCQEAVVMANEPSRPPPCLGFLL